MNFLKALDLSKTALDLKNYSQNNRKLLERAVFCNQEICILRRKLFYDMLEFVRFLDPDPSGKHIAYTTPDCMIFLNCPNNKIEYFK